MSSDLHHQTGPHAERAAKAATESYVRLLETFAELARQVGLHVRPYDAGRLHYAGLPAAMQARVLEQFQVYVEVCQGAMHAGVDVLDGRRLLWRFLVERRLRPPTGAFAEIKATDILEVYDVRDWVQTFRSLAFYHVCSYTLDDVLCRPWFELYARDEAITKSLLATGMSLAAADGPDVKSFGVGPHELEEINSDAGLRWLIDVPFCARLRDELGVPAALLNVNRAIRQLHGRSA